MSSAVSDRMIPWTVACQAPLPMGLSRPDFWSLSRLPYSPPRDRPHTGMEPVALPSPALAGGFLTTGPPGKPNKGVSSHREHTILNI